MRKKKDFMGRMSEQDYARAEEYMNAPLSTENIPEDVTEKRMAERIRAEKMKASIEKIKDDLRYSADIDLREARRKALQREYKKRGF